MRVVIAMMKHETNTFSPVPTSIGRFARGAPLPPRGEAALEAYKGTGSAMAAFIDIADREGWEIMTPIAASASPSAPVEDAAYQAITDTICKAVEAGCDAVMFDLHGAMVTTSLEHGEGALLARIRRIAPGVPIAVALDMHTNLYRAIVDNVTTLAGYQTYPHVDNYETGSRAGEALVRAIKGQTKPTLAWGTVPCCRTSCARVRTMGPTRRCRHALPRWRPTARPWSRRSSQAFRTPTCYWPQVKPAFWSVVLLRWDINVRESAVLGLVGAGGIGVALQNSMDFFQWNRVALILLLVFAVVIFAEIAVNLIRRRLI